jgi:hypothetical protein
MPVDAQIMPPSMLSKTAPLMPIKIPQILSLSMFKKTAPLMRNTMSVDAKIMELSRLSKTAPLMPNITPVDGTGNNGTVNALKRALLLLNIMHVDAQ